MTLREEVMAAAGLMENRRQSLKDYFKKLNVHGVPQYYGEYLADRLEEVTDGRRPEETKIDSGVWSWVDGKREVSFEVKVNGKLVDITVNKSGRYFKALKELVEGLKNEENGKDNRFRLNYKEF